MIPLVKVTFKLVQYSMFFHTDNPNNSQKLREENPIKFMLNRQVGLEIACLVLLEVIRLLKLRTELLCCLLNTLISKKNFLDVNYLPFNIANTQKGVEVVQKSSHTKYNATIENLKDKDLIVGYV